MNDLEELHECARWALRVREEALRSYSAASEAQKRLKAGEEVEVPWITPENRSRATGTTPEKLVEHYLHVGNILSRIAHDVGLAIVDKALAQIQLLSLQEEAV